MEKDIQNFIKHSIMEKWFDSSLTSLFPIALSALGIYVAVIVYTRIFGKRSFSKMSSFDFAMTVAVGSIIGTTVLSPSVDLLQGAVGLLVVYVLQWTAAMLRHNKHFQDAIDNTPLLLMDGQKILYDNLKKARLTESDLRSKLREANVIELGDIRAVVFETTGNISVLHSNDGSKKLDVWLLKDIKVK